MIPGTVRAPLHSCAFKSRKEKTTAMGGCPVIPYVGSMEGEIGEHYKELNMTLHPRVWPTC